MADVAGAERYLLDIGKELGAGDEGIRLDARGEADLILDGGLHFGLRLDRGTGSLWLRSQLFEEPAALPQPLLRAMLEADFLWRGTGGALLAIDAGGSLALLRRIDNPAGEAYADFRAKIEGFLNAAERYGAACAAAAAAPVAAPAADAGMVEPLLMIRG